MKEQELYPKPSRPIPPTPPMPQNFTPEDFLPHHLFPRVKSFPVASTKIAVVSNIHYMNKSLLKNNDAVESVEFKKDRTHKAMLEYSSDIFLEVYGDLIAEKPDIVLISGDLTKDGERVNHMDMEAFLYILQEFLKMKVFVIPGSCDIASPFAREYDTSSISTVDSVKSEEEFFTIYNDFGYNKGKRFDKTVRDPNSYSYLAKPYPNLWILAINAIDFSTVQSPSSRMGLIKKETMDWIKTQLQAKSADTIVLGLMYHNLVEHFKGQSQRVSTMIDSEDDNRNKIGWLETARKLASYGLNIMFTANSHVNDITSYYDDISRKTIYDVQPGGLVTTPCPYKIINLKWGISYSPSLDITTRYVKSIKAKIPTEELPKIVPGNQTIFEAFSEERLLECVMNGIPSVPQDLKSYFANGFIAHIYGDEKITNFTSDKNAIQNLITTNPAYLPYLTTIENFWSDLPPKDNNTVIQLQLATI